MLKKICPISAVAVFLCIFQLSQAGTHSGRDTLLLRLGLRLGHGITKITSGWNPACIDSLDIFYTDAEQCCLAIGCNCGMRIGSNNAIYLAKVSVDSIDFGHELALQDTTLFSKGGISHAFKYCPMAPSFFDGTSVGVINWGPFEGGIAVIKTFDSLYALVRTNPIYDGTRWGTTPRIQVDWMVQDNGKPYFPNPNSVSIKNQKSSWHRSSFGKNRTVHFDLQGRLFREESNCKYSRVMIEEKNGTDCRFVFPDLR